MRPNSYFVSTRMSPRSAQMRCPAAKSFIASTAASSKSFARDLAGREDLLARARDVVLPLGRLGRGREDRRRAASGASSAPRAAGGRRRRERRARSASRGWSTSCPSRTRARPSRRGSARTRRTRARSDRARRPRGSGRRSCVFSNHQAARRLSTCPLNGMVPSTRSKALMPVGDDDEARPSRV